MSSDRGLARRLRLVAMGVEPSLEALEREIRDLPVGSTLEAAENAAIALRRAVTGLRDEARTLERWPANPPSAA